MSLATIILSGALSLAISTDSLPVTNNIDSIPVVPPASGHDLVSSAIYEKVSAEAFDQYFKNFIDIDTDVQYEGTTLPDSVYAARLVALMSPIEMAFNKIVRQYIINYTTTNKGTMSVILGRAQYYFPMIEQELNSAGLPLELRILPAVESALQSTARSRAGAAGLWQFMFTTGKGYGLEVTTMVDERLDPVLATKAACKFLKTLYGMYNDWTLALAAYNCGSGNVNKAIARAGGKDKVTSFWDIYPYLPRETRGYVPAFIGASYAFAYHRQHNIEPRPAPLPIAVDTVMVSRPLSLKQLEATLGISIDTLTGLNPQYTEGIIPASTRPYPLTLPMADVSRYIAGEVAVHALDSVYLASYLNPKNIDENAAVNEITYRVKSGDNLGSIARKHGVTVTQIKTWNKLKNANKISVGQRLTIWK